MTVRRAVQAQTAPALSIAEQQVWILCEVGTQVGLRGCTDPNPSIASTEDTAVHTLSGSWFKGIGYFKVYL